MPRSLKKSLVAAPVAGAAGDDFQHREAALRRSNETLEERVRERTEAVRKSEVLKQAVFDAIAAQIVVIDEQGEIIDANETWKQSLGTETSAALDSAGPGSNYLSMCRRALAEGHEGAASIAECITAVLAEHDDPRRVEYRGRPRNGRDQWFALTVTPLGEEAGAVLLHENISVQRRLEGEILEISERERSQVGQELHDGLCQHLGGVALLAKTLSNALTNAGRPEAAPALELAQLIYSAVGQTRAVARGLRPVELDEGGLVAALQDLAEQANARIPTEVRTYGDPRVNDNEVATNLYRVAKEAVANTLRHSHAKHIIIRLRQSSDHLTLVIENDGVGLPAGAHSASGMGLRIMRYRANSIGARLTVANRASGGVLVKCSLPLATLARGIVRA
jgi:signal transduction histidine kinase